VKEGKEEENSSQNRENRKVGLVLGV